MALENGYTRTARGSLIPEQAVPAQWWRDTSTGRFVRNTVTDFLVKLSDGRRVIVESKATWSIPKELDKMKESKAFAERNGMTYVQPSGAPSRSHASLSETGATIRPVTAWRDQ